MEYLHLFGINYTKLLKIDSNLVLRFFQVANKDKCQTPSDISLHYKTNIVSKLRN